MKRQAKRDLIHVRKHLRSNKARCSSLQGLREVRIEAVKELAQERGVSKGTIDRNLKIAIGVDMAGNMPSVDKFLFQQVNQNH